MHGQCGRIVLDFPLGDNFERSWNLFTEFIIELLALLTYLQGSLINSKDRVISNFTKRETFFISYNNQVLLEVISSCAPLLVTSKKGPSFPFSLAKRKYTWILIQKKSLLVCFKSCQGVLFPQRKRTVQRRW